MASPRKDHLSWLTHPLAVPVLLGLSIAFVLAGVALGVARLGWGSALSGHQQGTSQPVATTSTISAYIVGAVNHPGVYTLPDGARIQDLLHAAGGTREGADLVRVDLAAKVFDGEEVYVPLIGEPYPDTINNGVKVNLNIATADDLRVQLGITTKTAQAIVTYRQQHGNFTAVDQLLLVPISRAIYDRIKLLVTV
jgi:competence protein ComEA